MTVVFDASQQTFTLWWQLVFPLAALVFTIGAFLRRARWLWRGVGIGLTILLLFVAVIFPIADFQHVQSVLRAGKVKTVEGVISSHKRETIKRFMGTSRGVGISTTNRYSSTTREQFFVGPVWFWFDLGGFASGASFTNAGDPPLPLANGSKARVTWFEDAWYDSAARIVKLELGADSSSVNRGTPAAGHGDFDAFWKRFSAAAAKGDEAGVKALTHFPFLFSGTPLDAARFDSIWMGIFPAPNRACFATAMPVPDGSAMSVSCGVYVYIFEKSGGRWQLASFTADPEAAQ